MTFKKKESPMASEDTQASVATLTENNNEIAVTEDQSVAAYLNQFRSSDDASDRTSLRFMDDFNPRPWQFRAFRHDEVMRADKSRRIKNDGFVQLKRGSGIKGLKFEDWFEEDAWNGECLTEGMMLDRTTGKGFPEYYWFVRPIAAYKARQIVESEHSGKYVNIKATERKQGQWAGERTGLVTVNDFDAGEETDPSGW
jgi:hypothetical protein